MNDQDQHEEITQDQTPDRTPEAVPPPQADGGMDFTKALIGMPLGQKIRMNRFFRQLRRESGQEKRPRPRKPKRRGREEIVARQKKARDWNEQDDA